MEIKLNFCYKNWKLDDKTDEKAIATDEKEKSCISR